MPLIIAIITNGEEKITKALKIALTYAGLRKEFKYDLIDA